MRVPPLQHHSLKTRYVTAYLVSVLGSVSPSVFIMNQKRESDRAQLVGMLGSIRIIVLALLELHGPGNGDLTEIRLILFIVE
jgi:hypothetical protein